MASSPLSYSNGQETPSFLPEARRTPSFSSSSRSHSWDSSSSSFSFDEEFPPYTPSPPLKFTGIPFSWEKIPGIPKQQSLKKKDTSATYLLPLPPAGNSNFAANKLLKQKEMISPKKYKKDPFFAALVECSKDDHDIGPNFGNIIWKGSSKITRSLTDRFGVINTYTSCKRTCAVSESLVYVPRSRGSPHHLLNHRSS